MGGAGEGGQRGQEATARGLVEVFVERGDAAVGVALDLLAQSEARLGDRAAFGQPALLEERDGAPRLGEALAESGQPPMTVPKDVQRVGGAEVEPRSGHRSTVGVGPPVPHRGDQPEHAAGQCGPFADCREQREDGRLSGRRQLPPSVDDRAGDLLDSRQWLAGTCP